MMDTGRSADDAVGSFPSLVGRGSEPSTGVGEAARAALIEAFEAIVGPRGLLQREDAQPYERGARYGQGMALCVLRPASVQEVQQIVRLCVAHGIRVVAQGANTGLVGSSTPDAQGDQVVISMGRLKSVCELDVGNRSVRVDAGFSLSALNERLSPHQLWFPVDLGADPMIGGMVATNTGGTRLVRYGDVRHNLLALEAVLFEPPGQHVVLGSALRKDNTGFDFKQLFVGTSGRVGVITNVTLEVHPRPQQSATALVVPRSDDAVQALLLALETQLGDFLAAFEGMSGPAMQAAIAHVPSLRNPFEGEAMPEFAVLIELESTTSAERSGMHLQEVLNSFLEAHFEALLDNAIVGHGESLWHLRHSISEGARGLGQIIAFDVSVPRSRVMAFLRAGKTLLAERFPHLHVVDFGHIADGGVHFNVVWPHKTPSDYDPQQAQMLRDTLYALVVEQFGGSFSAEHGVGPHNLRYYQAYTPAPNRALARQMQQMLDPRGLCGTVNFG